MISANGALSGFYDYAEVARSVLIAIAASYAALDLAGRVSAARGRARSLWLAGGAIAMGIGIWEMHFKGMLAFHLPVPVEYHWPTVLASLLVAIFASVVALYVASRQKMGPADALTGSVIMGAAIAGMHYIGMASMRLPAITRFSPLLVTCSILLAILFSLVALLMAFDLREESRWTVPRRLGSATVMGAAVSAMHYTGMAAACFMPASGPDLSHAVNISRLANNGIAMATLIVIVAAVATSTVDRRTGLEAQRLNQELERRVAERTLELEAVNQELRKEIVERKRAEKALRESEEHLRLVIDTIPQQIWTAAPDGSMDFFNAQWLSYTGLSQEEAQGDGWQRIIHPDDRERVVRALREAVANGTPGEQEFRRRSADGQYRWFLARVVPLKDSEGRIVRWYGTTTDIDDRKRAEERLRLVVDTTPAMLYSARPDGSLDFFNKRWLEYLGLPLPDIIGWGWTAAIHPEDIDGLVSKWRSSLATGEPYEAEARVRRADGEYRWMLNRKVPARDDQGNIVKWYGSSVDIEDRRRAEDAVRRSEDRLRLVIDTAPAMLHSARPDGYVDFFNKRWLEFVGVSLEDISGWRWTNVMHPEDVEAVVGQWRSSLATGKPFEAEARLRRADGEYRLMLLRKVPLRDAAGSIVKWYGSAIDIEERKRAEQELRQAEEHIRAILEYSPNWIFLKDTEGRYLLVNREIERVFGISQEQIKGKTDSEIFPSEQAAEYRANDVKVLRAGLPMEFEEMALLEDGPHTSIVHKFPLFDTHGNIYATGGVATDITERKRAEEARRYSEEQYRTVVETATDAVVSIAEDSKIFFVNPATTKIFGYDTSELIGRPLTMLMPESLRKLHEAGFKRYLATGERHLNWQGAELTALRKNGQEFPVEVSFGEMTSNGHKVFTGFIRDITEKKRAEDELRKQKEVFQKIFENIPVTISFIGQDGHIELINPEWERTIGWTLEEIGKQNLDLFAEFYPDPQYRQWVLDLIAASTGEWTDRKVKVRGGRVIDLAMAVVHLSDGTSIAIGRDITERKRAEDALRESEERFRAIFENAGVGAALVDWQGHPIKCNPTLQRMLGFTEDELRNKAFTEFTHPDDIDRDSKLYAEVLAGKREKYEIEKRYITKDGRVVWGNLIVSLMKNKDGTPADYMVGMVEDITERKRAEEQLHQTQQDLARVARIVIMGELTASIAHEINQPLAAVAMNASASLHWLASQPPNLDEARQAMANAMDEADRASDVIRRLRTLLQKTPPQMQAVNVNEVIRDVLALAHRQLITGGVATRTELAPDLPTVLGDRVQLQQVLLNLIMNAVDAMINTKDRPRTLLVKSAIDAGGVMVEVQDSGRGLDPEQASRIFDSLFTTKPEGIGMGLSISRSIVEAHGGRLRAEPGPSHGAVFQVILPKAA